jgi:hypothetical protein
VANISGRLTYANVMATLAVFLALGGGAWALSRNSVGAKQIKKNAVRAPEIKKNAVRAAEIRADAVGATEVADDSLTGGDLDELSLGEVPRAAAAGNADSVDGLSLERVFFKADPNTPVAAIASLGVLRINAGCDVAGNVVATVEPASGAPPLELKHEGEGNANGVFDDQSAVAAPRTITFGGTSAAGMVRVASANGDVAVFDFGYDSAPSFGGENVCTLSGILIG